MSSSHIVSGPFCIEFHTPYDNNNNKNNKFMAKGKRAFISWSTAATNRAALVKFMPQNVYPLPSTPSLHL